MLPSFTWVTKRTSGGLAYEQLERAADEAGDVPLILCAHGTGLNKAIWRESMEKMVGELDTAVDVVAFDFSGHGASRRIPGNGVDAQRCDWVAFAARDVNEMIDALGCRNSRRFVLGIGHSAGGSALVLAELEKPIFTGLTLVEPIIRDKALQGKTYSKIDVAMGKTAKWPSRAKAKEDMIKLYGFSARCIDDLCRDGLRGDLDGSVALTCAPDVEASWYAAGMQQGFLLPRIAEVQCPVNVVAGGMATTLLDLNGPNGKSVSSLDKYQVVAESFGRPRPLTVYEMGGHNLAFQSPDWFGNFAANAITMHIAFAGGPSRSKLAAALSKCTYCLPMSFEGTR